MIVCYLLAYSMIQTSTHAYLLWLNNCTVLCLFLILFFGHCCCCRFLSFSSSQVPTGIFLWTCHLILHELNYAHGSLWPLIATEWVTLRDLKLDISTLGKCQEHQKLARYIQVLTFLSPNRLLCFMWKGLHFFMLMTIPH